MLKLGPSCITQYLRFGPVIVVEVLGESATIAHLDPQAPNSQPRTGGIQDFMMSHLGILTV